MKSNYIPGAAALVDTGGGTLGWVVQDASAIGVNDVVTTIRNDYTATPVTTGADVVLIASVATAITAVEIFDSSGETLELKVNGVRKLLITPGGNDDVKSFRAGVGDSVEVRAISNNAAVGELDINFFG